LVLIRYDVTSTPGSDQGKIHLYKMPLHPVEYNPDIPERNKCKMNGLTVAMISVMSALDISHSLCRGKRIKLIPKTKSI